ncbi:hypothetical protein JMUB7547_28810 [Staphylococcus aureus]
MSASLVGSEMCIRDSDNRECRPNVSQPPVSYTHLTLPTKLEV